MKTDNELIAEFMGEIVKDIYGNDVWKFEKLYPHGRGFLKVNFDSTPLGIGSCLWWRRSQN